MTTYRTKDLYGASYLYAIGQKLVDLQRENGRCSFVFENGESCQALLKQYWSREAKVDPRGFVDAILSLKSRIFNDTGDKNEYKHAESYNKH